MYANVFKIKEKQKLTATYKYLPNDQNCFKKFKAEVHNVSCYFLLLYKRFPKLIQGIEDITWLHGDKKFLFEC